MDEVENIGIEQVETAAPETESHVEQPTQEQPVQESRQDRNWREMRRKQDELLRKLKTQEEIIDRLMSQKPPEKQEIDELETIGDDEYISVGKVKKLVEKKASKIAQEAAEKALREREQSQYLDRLKRQYTDFEEIVTPETLAILEEQDPDLATTIADLKDPYKIGMQTYKYIKAMGIANQAPQVRRVKEVEKRLEQNAKTVQSPQAYDKRPMAQAFKISEAEYKNLYQEMMQHASKVGGAY